MKFMSTYETAHSVALKTIGQRLTSIITMNQSSTLSKHLHLIKMEDLDMSSGNGNNEHQHEITMTNANTTIDASVVQSRILQSASLAAEAAKGENDDDMDMNTEEGGDGTGDNVQQPTFTKLSAMADRGGRSEYRRVRCPKHRYTPLRQDWEQILMPLVQFLKLQVRSLTYSFSFHFSTYERRKREENEEQESMHSFNV